jgi:hypothetical protein
MSGNLPALSGRAEALVVASEVPKIDSSAPGAAATVDPFPVALTIPLAAMIGLSCAAIGKIPLNPQRIRENSNRIQVLTRRLIVSRPLI